MWSLGETVGYIKVGHQVSIFILPCTVVGVKVGRSLTKSMVLQKVMNHRYNDVSSLAYI